MRRLNRILSVTLVAALGGVAVLIAGGSPAHAATPLFQMPFPCGQAWLGETRTDHNPRLAVDFNRTNDLGDPVVASYSGDVVRVENEGAASYGRWVEIRHPDGWRTRYAHLSAVHVTADRDRPGIAGAYALDAEEVPVPFGQRARAPAGLVDRLGQRDGCRHLVLRLGDLGRGCVRVDVLGGCRGGSRVPAADGQ